MSNYYAPWFYRINFVVILSYIELPWFIPYDIAIRNGKIVWKHGANLPFCAFILRTKLYENPFFSTVHQNVDKSKSKVVGLFMDIIFTFF